MIQPKVYEKMWQNCYCYSNGQSQPVQDNSDKEILDYRNCFLNFALMKRKIYVASSWRNGYYPEAGWFAGRNKQTIANIPERQEPELMHKLFSKVCCSIDELIDTLK